MISMATLGLGIVFLMVERPDWLWSIITLVMALLVGVILAQLKACRPPAKGGPTLDETCNLRSRRLE